MKERINQLLHALNENLYEREEVIQLALLTTISGESIFLLGPPGVAKSLIARRIKEIFKNGKSFEYLMNRFSTPDEIFGPIAISKLKEEDKYERVVDKYLPSADIVFLDEIWKAGPSIQNSLLTVINEKIYRNGSQEIKTPLKGLISASNELPAKGEGLEALWDRFIIRYFVDNIQNGENFNAFLCNSNISFNIDIDEKLKITNKEFNDWQKKIDEITISDETLNVINVIRNYIAKYNNKEDCEKPIYISDRRWKKIVRVLKTSAFLNNREKTDLMDCFLIVHTLWDEVEHINKLKEFVTDAIKNHGYSLTYDLSSLSNEIDKLKLDISNQTKERKKIEYYTPKEIQTNGGETFYEIDDKSNNLKDYRGHYIYIKKSDFENLNHLYEYICLCSKNRQEIYMRLQRYQIRLENQEQHQVSIKINCNECKFNLKTNKRKETEITTKKPHKAILKEWDKKVSNIIEEISKSIKKIESNKDKDLASLKNNLFVNKNLAELAEYNLNQTIGDLISKKLEVEKLKQEYDAIQ